MNIETYQNILRHDLSSFVHFSFKELNPYTDYYPNWHIQLMAYHLARVLNGECKRLIINLPPRMLKSHCASIALPSWILGKDPSKKVLYLHGSTVLGRELEEDSYDLMMKPRYRALFPHTVIKRSKNKLITSFGGFRQQMPIMGRLTGLGADIIVIDDPISTNDVHDPSSRKSLNNQCDENLLQRLNDKNNGAIILIMQRLHEDDLTSHLLSKNEDWTHINLPAIAIEDEVWKLPHGKEFRRKKGEAIIPFRESPEQLIETLYSIGGYAFAYQYLQGLYNLKFGEYGQGALWLTPYEEGVFWDARENKKGIHGFHSFKEEDLILPEVFGVGESLYPKNMRHQLTTEEWLIEAAIQKENMLKNQQIIL